MKPKSTCHVTSSDSPFSHLYASVQKRPSEARPAETSGKSAGGKEPARNTSDLSSNLNELDSLLAELSSSQFVAASSDRHPTSCMNDCHHFSVFLFLRRLLWVDLIKWVSNVRPSAHRFVCPSTKSFFDFNEIWYVARGRRVMHDGMQYEPIQRRGQGYEPLKVGNSTIFEGYLLPH